jgi:heme exporter protein A
VALALLAASPAELWLLDEPAVGLDAASVALLEALIAEHRNGGGMVALSTHTEMALGGAETLDLAAFAVARRSLATATA